MITTHSITKFLFSILTLSNFKLEIEWKNIYWTILLYCKSTSNWKPRKKCCPTWCILKTRRFWPMPQLFFFCWGIRDATTALPPNPVWFSTNAPEKFANPVICAVPGVASCRLSTLWCLRLSTCRDFRWSDGRFGKKWTTEIPNKPKFCVRFISPACGKVSRKCVWFLLMLSS